MLLVLHIYTTEFRREMKFTKSNKNKNNNMKIVNENYI